MGLPGPENKEETTKTISVDPTLDFPGERAGEMIGRYRLIEKLGEGGMGSVWVAEQVEDIKRKVALKVVKLGMDTRQVVARFEAERQALALMAHPYIAKVLDAGATASGRPFFVMELVKGVPITDYCDRHSLSIAHRLELVVQVCEAVQHAHQKGIVHRDIKPQNILVEITGTTPAPRIIDFGIAKAIAGQRLTEKTVHTAFEEFIGTPSFMSPEQAEMNALGIDARSDIYSLGVMLYELLTGLGPFKAKFAARPGTEEIRRIIREEEAPRPSACVSALPEAEQATLARRRQSEPAKLIQALRGDLDWIVVKCLEKDRSRRYQTAEELALDLRRHLSHEVVQAGPPGGLYQLRKLARRRRRPLAVIAPGLLIALLAGILFAFYWPRIAQRPQRSTSELLTEADKLLTEFDRTDRIPQAITLLDTGLKNDNENPEIWAKRAWAYWLQFYEDELEKSKTEAKYCAEKALERNRALSEPYMVQGLISMLSGNAASATNLLVKANDLAHSSDGLILASLASACRLAGNSTDADAYAGLAEKRAGRQWQVWYSLGRYYFDANPRSRDLTKAQARFERAVSLAPKSPLAHRHLASVLLLEGSTEAALEHLRKSWSLRQRPSTASMLGSVYLRQHRYKEAADYFLKASAADPANYLYHVNAGIALRANRDTNASEEFHSALGQIESQIRISSSSNALLRAYHEFCQAALEQRDEAKKALEQLLQEDTNDLKALGIIHDAYKMLGENEKAGVVMSLIQQKSQNSSPTNTSNSTTNQNNRTNQ